jgi:hypothetical protein
VLRRYQRERASLDAAADADDEARYMHPRWVIERLRVDWPDDWSAVLEAGNVEPPMWLRVNLRRTTRDGYARRLAEECDQSATPSPHAPAALRLGTPCDVQSLPGIRRRARLRAGRRGAARRASARARIAGARARRVRGPRGKTAQILEQWPDARVTAVDLDPERIERYAREPAASRALGDGRVRRRRCAAGLVGWRAVRPDPAGCAVHRGRCDQASSQTSSSCGGRATCGARARAGAPARCAVALLAPGGGSVRHLLGADERRAAQVERML